MPLQAKQVNMYLSVVLQSLGVVHLDCVAPVVVNVPQTYCGAIEHVSASGSGGNEQRRTYQNEASASPSAAELVRYASIFCEGKT
jgi:hypothetical protein